VKILNVKTAAVLGAGTMGAQLAACFANANIKTYLYDLNSELASQGHANLLKLRPEPIHDKKTHKLIKTRDLSNLIDLENCDIIIEAVAENIEIKKSLLEKISPHIKNGTWVGSNTSGLSINELANTLPENLQTNFLGTHFFNPPRYLPLVEIIPSRKTSTNIESLLNFIVSKLGKEVVIAPDSPNFIANRVGLFSLLLTAKNAVKFDIPLEVVDELTGIALDRPKSATFRTADVVGLDILSNAINTSSSVKHDPWNSIHELPQVFEHLISNNHLGQKSKKGIYEKREDGIYVIDLKDYSYRKSNKSAPTKLIKLLNRKLGNEELKQLSKSNEKHHKFLWLTLAELLHYCSWLCEDLDINTADLDNAICLGFGWEVGPFKLWQNAGIASTTELIQKNLDNMEHNVNINLPDYLSNCQAFFKDDKAFNPKKNEYETPLKIESSERSTFKRVGPQTISNQSILTETKSSKLWQQDQSCLIFSIKTKLATIDNNVLDELDLAISKAEKEQIPLIIWHDNEKNFGAGANLKVIGTDYMLGGNSAIKKVITKFQQVVMHLKYASIPTIAAVQGVCLGGSCEIMLHCSHRIVAYNSYIGLVEAGVGLIPGAGGSKEMAVRALKSNNPTLQLANNFRTIAMGQLATSAHAAIDMGFLDQSDTLIANPNELLYTSKVYAKALATTYSAPIADTILAPGLEQIAKFQFEIANMQAGGFASEHDCLIATKLANVMCGGNISKPQEVSEQYLLELEQERFLELLGTWKTKQRIAHMLKTGKRLAN
jgi:3-hydroxyacyl-CoA dehydrogenase